ncbi:MAG TPA: hypothetical protein VLC46_23585 [Thermoanaerobaculia bacterium]|jgi:hypothetical protein|nr:hypothetical protein [Thermoanaerobaculia bacterium]
MLLPDVLGWIEVGEMEGVDAPHGLILSWGELASFAMGFWSQESIETALGTDLSGATPSSSASATWKCVSPNPRSWPWNASPTATASQSTPSSRASCWDVVSAHSEYLATAIPGFTAALRWPQ